MPGIVLGSEHPEVNKTDAALILARLTVQTGRQESAGKGCWATSRGDQGRERGR